MFSKNFKLTVFLLVVLTTFSFAQLEVNEHSIKFEDATTASLVGENGLIMRTTDNGASWSEQTSNISNVLFGNSFYGGLSLAVGENGVVLRSDDNGQNWSVILPGTLEHLNDVEVIDANTSVVCGNAGTILVSTNSGLNWIQADSLTSSNLLDVKFLPSGVGFISGEEGTLLRSTDAGATWSQLDMSFTNRKFSAVEAVDENTLIVIGENSTIFMSNNGGESWYGASGLVYENDFNDVVFFDPFNGVIAANDGLLLKTTDGGETWSASEVSASGDDYDYFSVAFADVNNGISIGRNGIEVYTTDGGNSWSETAPAFLNTNLNRSAKKIPVNLYQNYPNPFNPSTMIGYELSFDANVTVKVYDIAGQEVASLVSAFKTAGNYSVNFNAANLSSGVYFYKLSASGSNGEFSKVMKMILTK